MLVRLKINWLLTLEVRKDLPNSPIGYILINKNEKINFFCDLKKVSNSLKKNLKDKVY